MYKRKDRENLFIYRIMEVEGKGRNWESVSIMNASMSFLNALTNSLVK